jgi:putative transposase
MGRQPRIIIEGYYYHIIVRCNNKEFLFTTDENFAVFFDILKKYKERYLLKLYCYAIMANHFHLIVEPANPDSLSQSMREILTNYSKWYNKKNQRRGHIWESRYKACIIENDSYAFGCMRYIDLNPVRAGIVTDPKDYKWSTHRYYAYGESNILIDTLPLYETISPYDKTRRRKYREFVITPFDSEEAKELYTSRFIGSSIFTESFKRQI